MSKFTRLWMAVILWFLHGVSVVPAKADPITTIWKPLQQQYAEPDTTFLLNGSVEQSLSPLDGGFLSAIVGTTDISNAVSFVPGKYRTGIQSLGSNGSYITLPVDGLLPQDQFTIEFWVESTSTAWASISNNVMLVIGDRSNNYTFAANRGSISFREVTTQTPTGISSQTQANSAPSVAQNWSLNEWHHIAGTLRANVITLYVDGVKITSIALATPMKSLSCTTLRDGLVIGGTITGASQPTFAISDLRISRYARTPNVTTTIDSALTLNVDAGQETGSNINPHLLGGLHWMRQGPQYSTFPDGTTYSENMLGNPNGVNGTSLLYAIQTDHFLNATPMIFGIPDAAHPAIGHSGSYSYDWTNVDLEMQYLRKMGVKLILSVDSTPSILGGTNPPYTPAQELTTEPWQAPWNNNLPNDGSGPMSASSLTAFATISTDLLYHLVTELGDADLIDRVTIWNEPEWADFWAGTLSQWYPLYNATAKAIKASFPTLKIGGPVFSRYSEPNYTDFLTSAAAAGAPVDFLAFHYYSGDIADLDWQCARLRTLAASKGFGSNIDITVNEWANQLFWRPVIGNVPLNEEPSITLGDYSAAFAASALMAMQRNNVAAACFTFPAAGLQGQNLPAVDAASGLFADTHPWSNGNVFRLWQKMAPTILATSAVSAPIQYIASHDPATGRVTILISYQRFRKSDPALVDSLGTQESTDLPVSVNLSNYAAPYYVRHYVIDDQHSDYLDAGPSHGDLETVPGQTLSLTLRARSVHLVEISPTSPMGSLALNPSSVTGGSSTTATVTLDDVTPNPAVVTLASDGSGTVSMPSTITVPAGSASASFTVSTVPVAAATPVHITASLAGVSRSATLTVATPALSSLAIPNANLTIGSAGVGSVAINAPAPSAGVNVALASDNPAIVLPATVVVPAGQMSGSFSFTAGSVTRNTSVNITAQYGGVTKSASVMIESAKLAALSVPAANPGGKATTGKVFLSDLAAFATTVYLFSDGPVSVPQFVTVPAGQNSAAFAITSAAVSADTAAVIGASYRSDGSSRISANIMVTAPVLSRFTVSPASVAGGAASNGNITINVPAPAAGTTLSITTSNPAATVPPTVTVPAGSVSAVFPITTTPVATDTNGSVSVTLGNTQSSSFVVKAATLSTVSVSPGKVMGGTGATGKVSLTGPAFNDTTVYLASSSPAVSVPGSVTIAAGASSASFAVVTAPVSADTSSSVSASLTGGGTAGVSTTVIVAAPTLSRFGVSPASVAGGSIIYGSVSINGPAPAGGAVVTIALTNPAATAPATVTIPAGALSAVVPITTSPVAADTPGTVTATLGTSLNSSFVVKAAALSTLSVSPASVVGGRTSTGKVSLTGPASSAMTIYLFSSNPAAAVPSSVIIPAGQASVSFTVTTASVTGPVSAGISASLSSDGTAALSSTLTVTQ